MQTIKIKKLNDLAKLPTRGSEYAAGYDLYAATADNVVIPPHSTVKIDTGIAIELNEFTFGAIYPRSGLATKGLRLANCTGVVDADYRGPIIVAMHNDTNNEMTIEKGDRIAQLVVQEYIPIEFIETKELSETVRGDGGFGSTGMK